LGDRFFGSGTRYPAYIQVTSTGLRFLPLPGGVKAIVEVLVVDVEVGAELGSGGVELGVETKLSGGVYNVAWTSMAFRIERSWAWVVDNSLV